MFLHLQSALWISIYSLSGSLSVIGHAKESIGVRNGNDINTLETVNDAAPIPPPHPSEGSYHWTFERLVNLLTKLNSRYSWVGRWNTRKLANTSVSIIYRIVAAGLIPLTIAPFAGGSLSPVTDAVLCGLLVVHSHVGFQ